MHSQHPGKPGLARRAARDCGGNGSFCDVYSVWFLGLQRRVESRTAGREGGLQLSAPQTRPRSSPLATGGVGGQRRVCGRSWPRPRTGSAASGWLLARPRFRPVAREKRHTPSNRLPESRAFGSQQHGSQPPSPAHTGSSVRQNPTTGWRTGTEGPRHP